jgi:23S rRNA (adenine1618-N6)-methyltransferase
MTATGRRPVQVKGRAATAPKAGMHPRNPHRQRYDFPALVATHAALARFVATNRHGDASIDFADAHAVKALNQALLRKDYGVTDWDIPAEYLCPPLPGRADYLHHLADLLASTRQGVIPRGTQVRILDIGCGANCIYPIIGHRAYGWRFVGSDVDAQALRAAQRTIDANRVLRGGIELRLQTDPGKAFSGIIADGEAFAATICNPPFHASLREAHAHAQRKWDKLGKDVVLAPGEAPRRNFGGQGAELWCQGGEVGFIVRMISDSARMPRACRWFTTLVSKEASLPPILRALKGAGVRERRTIEMLHGQKRSRIVGWSFVDGANQDA